MSASTIHRNSTPGPIAPPDAPRSTVGPLLRLAWPVLVEQVLVMLVGFSDTVLAGHYLQEQHLAAMTMMSYVLWMLNNLFTIISIGALALTARFVGGGDMPMANRVLNQAYLAGGVMAAVLTVVGLILGGTLIGLMQLDAEAAALALRYLRFLLPLLPAMMCEAIGIACLRGAGDTITGLVAMVLVNVVNIAVAWSLLLGVGPLPALGWDSLAIGTACGHFIGGVVPLAVLCYGRAGLKLSWPLARFDGSLVRRILRIGIPGGVDALSVVLLQLVFLAMVNHLGRAAAAAHGVAIRLESLAYLPGTAFQVAAATLAGQYLGAGNPRQATRVVKVASLWCCGLMSTAGLAMFFGADQLVAWFLGANQPEVAEMAAPLLQIIAWAMPPLALLMVLTGALRGAGDTRWPLAFTLIGFLVVRMPLAYYFAYYLAFGVRGAWYAMVADLTVRCLFVIGRFTHGGWRRVQV